MDPELIAAFSVYISYSWWLEWDILSQQNCSVYLGNLGLCIKIFIRQFSICKSPRDFQEVSKATFFFEWGNCRDAASWWKKQELAHFLSQPWVSGGTGGSLPGTESSSLWGWGRITIYHIIRGRLCPFSHPSPAKNEPARLVRHGHTRGVVEMEKEGRKAVGIRDTFHKIIVRSVTCSCLPCASTCGRVDDGAEKTFVCR